MVRVMTVDDETPRTRSEGVDVEAVRTLAAKWFREAQEYPYRTMRIGDAFDALDAALSAPVPDVAAEGAPMFSKAEMDEQTALWQSALEDRDTAILLLADIVNRAATAGEDEDGWIIGYIMPTGPIHRAIPFLQAHHVYPPHPKSFEDAKADVAAERVAAADALRDAATELWHIFLILPNTPSPLGDRIQSLVQSLRDRADATDGGVSRAATTPEQQGEGES